jgi:hypothetical protein
MALSEEIMDRKWKIINGIAVGAFILAALFWIVNA